MTEIIAELKILREYRIPVGDPAGTLSVVGQKNQYTVRMYTTLSMKYIHRTTSKHHSYVNIWRIPFSLRKG